MRGVASYHKMKQELSDVGSEIRNVGGKLIKAGRQKQWERFQQDFQEVGNGDGGGVGVQAGLINDQLVVYLLNLTDMTSEVF